MSNDNRNSDTFEFKPEAVKKRQVERRENDEYSAARRNYAGRQQPEKNGNGLIILAVVLTILLIVTIVAGIFILKGDKDGENTLENPDNNTVIDISGEEENEEEEEEEVKNITVSCSMVFYADSVIKKNGGYTILADLYDEDFYKFDNRKLTINSDTDIRESGKRLSPEALVYIIESMAGESLVFDGEIKEEDGTVLSITFDSSFREELEEEKQEEKKPEENNQESQNGEKTENEEKPQENIPEGENNPPAENNTQNAEGAVVTQ